MVVSKSLQRKSHQGIKLPDVRHDFDIRVSPGVKDNDDKISVFFCLHFFGSITLREKETLTFQKRFFLNFQRNQQTGKGKRIQSVLADTNLNFRYSVLT